MSDERLTVVQVLLDFSRPLDEVQQQLSGFGWDFEGVPAVLHPDHIVDVLQRYLRGELTASTVERWGDLIEGREDISFHSEWLTQTVHEITNPILHDLLDVTRARALIAEGSRA